jgi:RND superfamily putative drug exporter
MTLLGDKNWWAPGPLRRLHDRYGLHEAPDPAGHRVAAAQYEGMAHPGARPAAGIRSGT